MTGQRAEQEGACGRRGAGPEPSPEALGAAADWYHAYFTGLVLFVVGRRGVARAEPFVHEIFSHQRTTKFVPGLEKLGLLGLPHAVAAARYHYLSNWIGGVAVEYMGESDRKAWIRYTAPRWVWAGTALCAVPSSVTKAMLAGWHAQNGVSLGNPRLGFVCTKLDTDGDSGLEGYYFEYDRNLLPDERLRFAPGEEAPEFDPALAPTLPMRTWPAARLQKARRNYAMEYVRSAYVIAHRLWGLDEAREVLGRTARLIGMQFHHSMAAALGAGADAGGAVMSGAEGLADFIVKMGEAQGDTIRRVAVSDGWDVIQEGSTFFGSTPTVPIELASSWSELMAGARHAHDRRLTLMFDVLAESNPSPREGGQRMSSAPDFRWRIREGAGK